MEWSERRGHAVLRASEKNSDRLGNGLVGKRTTRLVMPLLGAWGGAIAVLAIAKRPLGGKGTGTDCRPVLGKACGAAIGCNLHIGRRVKVPDYVDRGGGR